MLWIIRYTILWMKQLIFVETEVILLFVDNIQTWQMKTRIEVN